MKKRFTEWYAKTYGLNDGPWWVEFLCVFLWSPSVYYATMATDECYERWSPTMMVRINVYSEMNADINFDISVPWKDMNKTLKLIPKCGAAWYDYPGFYDSGWTEPLCAALDKLGINYILHDDVDNTQSFMSVKFAG